MQNETPAPEPPMAGKPSQPYMKMPLRGTLRASMASETHIVMRGRERAALTEMKVRAKRQAGSASAVKKRNSAAIRATSPSTLPSEIQRSVYMRSGTPKRQRKPPSQKFCSSSSPTAL